MLTAKVALILNTLLSQTYEAGKQSFADLDTGMQFFLRDLEPLYFLIVF